MKLILEVEKRAKKSKNMQFGAVADIYLAVMKLW